MTANIPPLKQPITQKGDQLPRPWFMWFQSIYSRIGEFIDGSGTAGTIPKWSASKTLTDSIITEASSKISVTTGTDINDFSDDGTMADESSDALVTENAVVTYLRSKKIDTDELTPTTGSNGEISQVLYKRSSVTVVTEVRTYTANMNISTQVFTGEYSGTWTHSYTTAGTWTGMVKT